MRNLTTEQVMAIRCAHADLQGALQCHEQADYTTHEWDAHRDTIQELEDAFPEILDNTMTKIKIVSTPWIFAPGFFKWIREAVAPLDQPKAAELLVALGVGKGHAKFLANPKNKVKTDQDGGDLTLEFITPNQ